MRDYKILVIDYEPRGIQQLREPLETAGFEVEVAKDGLTAFEVFNRYKPHLTLIEAMLPKKHGFEVCQDLKKTPHGMLTPVVIVTSVYKGRKYRTQALHHYGCDEYLEKPIAPELLLETVNRLLQESGDGASAPQLGKTVTAASGPASVSASPTPAPAAPPAAAAPAAPSSAVTSTASNDDAELEIMERLDEILPGGLDR